MGTFGKKKKEPKPNNYQLNLELAQSLIFDRGFKEGAKQQRESDINSLIELLETLEEIHGVGEITAQKIRDTFLNRFGVKNE